MSQPFSDACLASAENEVDAEFVDAPGLEAIVEAELLVEEISIEGMGVVY